MPDQWMPDNTNNRENHANTRYCMLMLRISYFLTLNLSHIYSLVITNECVCFVCVCVCVCVCVYVCVCGRHNSHLKYSAIPQTVWFSLSITAKARRMRREANVTNFWSDHDSKSGPVPLKMKKWLWTSCQREMCLFRMTTQRLFKLKPSVGLKTVCELLLVDKLRIMMCLFCRVHVSERCN